MAGIYIHIPFCKQACYYCDFHFSTSTKNKVELIQSINKELVIKKNKLKSPIETIYFGGGTPSLLNNEELSSILKTIQQNYDVVENPEITLEANPDDLTDYTVFKKYKKLGINRLSIGVQSFFDTDLTFLNRAHSAKEAIESLREATKYFDNITIDLIYGIPNLSTEKWKENLKIAFDLGVNHISSYALTVEPKTTLHQFIKTKKYPKLDENLALEHFKILVSETKKQGFIHYEVSNFAKPKYASKHNQSYWQGKAYLGIGPSAHSFDGKTRSWNVANNNIYIKKIKEGLLPQETEILTKQDLFNETIMISLRTINGIDLNKIETNFGEKQVQFLVSQAKKHLINQTLILEKNTLKSTKKGVFLIDGIASDLFWV